MLHKIYLYEII